MKKPALPRLTMAIAASQRLSKRYEELTAANTPEVPASSKVVSITSGAWAARRRRNHHD